MWEDGGEHFCDSTLDAPLTLGVAERMHDASLNWSLREQLSWGSAETHHFMFAHATGRLCTPPSNRLAAVLTYARSTLADCVCTAASAVVCRKHTPCAL